MKISITGRILMPATFILASFLFTGIINGQVKSDIPGYLRQRFINYIEATPREEIFLHSDREEYVAGEVLWFKIYLIDRQSFKTSSNSRLAYVEILNTDNRPVVQKKILMDNGTGSGQIVLPDTLSNGKYMIRVYTRWMRNFFPANCYTKEIRIYNSINSKVLSNKSHPDLKQGTVNGPARISDNDANGFILNVNNLKPDSLELVISANSRYLAENSNIIYLFIQTHGVINHVSAEKLGPEYTKINIPKDELIPGISQVTVFNAKGWPVAERYVYSKAEEKIHPVLISPDSCRKRSRMIIGFDLGNELSSGPDSADLSISVAPLVNSSEITGINDYMIFGTEYGTLPLNLIKKRKISELPLEVIDSILLNIKSNWIDWQTILSRKTQSFKYMPENEDHFLSGKLLTNDGKAAPEGELLFLCTPGKEAEFQYASTDSEGGFSFNLHIDEAVKDLIIMPAAAEKNYKINIESSFSENFIQPGIPVDSTREEMPSDISQWSVNYQVSKIYGIAAIKGPLNAVVQPLKPVSFYGRPDIELIMADYIKLPVMEEVFAELLPHVSLKKKKGSYEIIITDRVDDRRYVASPSLMIDGVIIKDPSLIANLDPEIIERIDVIKGRYLVGNYYFYGIVNLVTKAGDFSCIPFPDYMSRLHYRVLDQQWSFSSPDYSEGIIKDRIPDFRNTLYWNPSVRVHESGKAQVEFWTSDVITDYMINIQGMTAKGKLFSAKKVIRMK